MSSEVLLILATFPDTETARRIAGILVEERLVACVNLFPQVESIYRWKGQVEIGVEVAAWMKTTHLCYPALEVRYRELHPYEVPALVAIEVEGGLPGYLQWVGQNCGE